MKRRDWLGYSVRQAPEVDLRVLRAVHPATYIDEIRFMSERGGGSFDPDTVASEGSYVAGPARAGRGGGPRPAGRALWWRRSSGARLLSASAASGPRATTPSRAWRWASASSTT